MADDNYVIIGKRRDVSPAVAHEPSNTKNKRNTNEVLPYRLDKRKLNNDYKLQTKELKQKKVVYNRENPNWIVQLLSNSGKAIVGFFTTPLVAVTMLFTKGVSWLTMLLIFGVISAIGALAMYGYAKYKSFLDRFKK